MRTKNIEIFYFSDHSCKPGVATIDVKNNLIMLEKECEKSHHIQHLKFFVKRCPIYFKNAIIMLLLFLHILPPRQL